LKFGTVIAAFNVLVLCFLGALFLIPPAMLGLDLAAEFLYGIWFLCPAVLGAAVWVDIFYVRNRVLYRLLEKEDWPALIQELEDRVFRRGNYSRRLVKLLANTYLVLSDARGVTELEKKLRMNKAVLVSENALVFGAARILAKDMDGAARFFAARMEESKNPWLYWYYGFALLLDRKFAGAAEIFTSLARESDDGIICGLSAYFLSETLDKFMPEKALYKIAAEGKARVRAALKRRSDWKASLKNIETEVFAAVLNSYLAKAADYIYQ
jgi:hypothetical protein